MILKPLKATGDLSSFKALYSKHIDPQYTNSISKELEKFYFVTQMDTEDPVYHYVRHELPNMVRYSIAVVNPYYGATATLDLNPCKEDQAFQVYSDIRDFLEGLPNINA